jgi:hypothetical protein
MAASALASRISSDDDSLLDTLQPLNFLLQFGDPPLALGPGAWRVRDPVDLGP